jgi:hypothetical protein
MPKCNGYKKVQYCIYDHLDGRLCGGPVPEVELVIGGNDEEALHRVEGEAGDDALRHPHLGAGLPIKTHPKNPKKNHIKNPLKWGFLGFLIFFIFYENNTNFSL